MISVKLLCYSVVSIISFTLFIPLYSLFSFLPSLYLPLPYHLPLIFLFFWIFLIFSDINRFKSTFFQVCLVPCYQSPLLSYRWTIPLKDIGKNAILVSEIRNIKCSLSFTHKCIKANKKAHRDTHAHTY